MLQMGEQVAAWSRQIWCSWRETLWVSCLTRSWSKGELPLQARQVPKFGSVESSRLGYLLFLARLVFTFARFVSFWFCLQFGLEEESIGLLMGCEGLGGRACKTRPNVRFVKTFICKQRYLCTRIGFH